MEKPKLFGDIYDIISCYVFILIGFGLCVFYFVNGYIGFLYAGLACVLLFGGLLAFSYYARHKKKFTEFKDLKSVLITLLVVLVIIFAFILIFLML